MTAVLDALPDALATYRLTRLATADAITQPVRDRIIELAYMVRGDAGAQVAKFEAEHGEMIEGDWQFIVEQDDVPPKLATLVTCRWCAGFWISGLVVVARAVAPRTWGKASKVLALSALAALIAGLEQD